MAEGAYQGGTTVVTHPSVAHLACSGLAHHGLNQQTTEASILMTVCPWDGSCKLASC